MNEETYRSVKSYDWKKIGKIGLICAAALVVLIGARRVNDGQTAPGVILAFLTYFNMILMGVMGLNRIFMMMSKANASARRIADVVGQPAQLLPLPAMLSPLPCPATF